MSDKPVLVFDFFGVLCKEVGNIWIEKHNLETHEEAISEIEHRADVGDISFAEECELLGKISGQSGEEVMADFVGDVQMNTELIDFLKNAKDKYRLALLSNASSEFVKPLIANNGLEEIFERIYISSDLGMAKPEINVFKLVCATMGASPEQCIMIDDRVRNIDGAKAAGMKGILYNFS